MSGGLLGLQPSGLVVSEFTVSTTHHVHVKVRDAPWHTTPSGRRPIRVAWLAFAYRLNGVSSEVRGVHVELAGFPERGAKWAASRAYPSGVVRRSFPLEDTTLDWIRQLADQAAPVHGAPLC